MRLFIVSDFHITGTDDPLYQSLLTFLRKKVNGEDRVVIAGDLFDLWVGNKSFFLNMYQEFFEELTSLGKKGTQIDYIEGNHDFLIKKNFEHIPNMAVYSDEITLTIDGKNFYIAHGDLVNSKDYGYRFLRGFFRSLIMQIFVAVIPGNWLNRIGKAGSASSRKRRPSLPSDLPLLKREELRRIYRSFAAEKLAEGFDFVVMGHCHDLDEMSFNIGLRTGQYINVGFPRIHGSFLSWSPGDQKIQRERLP